MTPQHPDNREEPKSSVLLDLPRFGIAGLIAAIILLGLYWGSEFATAAGYGSSLFGYGFLLIVPFVATLTFVALVRVFWGGRRYKADFWGALVSVLLVLVLFGFALALPILLCFTMAAPLGILGAIAGGFASRWVLKIPPHIQALVIISLLAATGATLVLEPRLGYPTNSFVVTRSIVIAAAPEQIWPHLLKLDDLQPNEQQWTFSQNVLGIPRPTEAVVHGEGVGAVRTARWQRDVWFEEHITSWRPGKSLDWKFVFPDGSTFTTVDQHIDPRGPNVVIETGGYELVPLSNGQTRLDLYTSYSASTAVNGYGWLWGEVILGDVQGNILSIVRRRAEGTSKSPDDAKSLIASN